MLYNIDLISMVSQFTSPVTFQSKNIQSWGPFEHCHSCSRLFLVVFYLLPIMFSLPPAGTLPSLCLENTSTPSLSELPVVYLSILISALLHTTVLVWGESFTGWSSENKADKVSKNESGPVEKVFPLITTRFSILF